MKRYTITKLEDPRFLITNLEEKKVTGFVAEGPEEMQVSDGYHTMDELYEHRHRLWITICRVLTRDDIGWNIWRSLFHNDGTTYKGWFILGINESTGQQITYHLPMKHWNETDFAKTLEKAPLWDGHTPEDVLNRLYKL